MTPEETRQAVAYRRRAQEAYKQADRMVVLKALAHALLYYARSHGMAVEEVQGNLHRMRTALDGPGASVILSPGGAASRVGAPDNPDPKTRAEINRVLKALYGAGHGHKPLFLMTVIAAWAFDICQACGTEREALVERIAVLDRVQRLESPKPRPFVEATQSGGMGY